MASNQTVEEKFNSRNMSLIVNLSKQNSMQLWVSISIWLKLKALRFYPQTETEAISLVKSWQICLDRYEQKKFDFKNLEKI